MQNICPTPVRWILGIKRNPTCLLGLNQQRHLADFQRRREWSGLRIQLVLLREKLGQKPNRRRKLPNASQNNPVTFLQQWTQKSCSDHYHRAARMKFISISPAEKGINYDDTPVLSVQIGSWASATLRAYGRLQRMVSAQDRGRMLLVVLRIFILKILVIWANFDEFWRFWYRLQNFEKSLVRIVRQYSDQFWKILTFEFGWNRKVMINHRGGILFFCQNLNFVKIENFKSLTLAQIQILRSLTLNPNFRFWQICGSLFNLVLPNLNRSRRQLSNDTKIVKFGQNLVQKFLISQILWVLGSWKSKFLAVPASVSLDINYLITYLLTFNHASNLNLIN